MSERLFTPRFFIMCAYTFTVFVSVFQLLPTAPYHVLDLGGSTTAAGLFLGFLTYSSAISAPFTGSIGDRIGQRRRADCGEPDPVRVHRQLRIHH
jgi:MFS family permease